MQLAKVNRERQRLAVVEGGVHLKQKLQMPLDVESCYSFRDEEKPNCIVGTVGKKGGSVST